MFGHDNDNNDDNNGQITLPPAQEMEQENHDAPVKEEVEVVAPASEPTREAPKVSAGSNDLLDIKQQALQALTPLVDHLEQSPEEKFRTTMMMIQASDNHELIRVAYEAAQQISSEKDRAQALLDIVNEINYFTQQNQQS